MADDGEIDIFDSVEDDILDDFYNGNWTDGANEMLDNDISPINLAKYIEEREDKYPHIDLSYMVSICNAYEVARKDRGL